MEFGGAGYGASTLQRKCAVGSVISRAPGLLHLSLLLPAPSRRKLRYCYIYLAGSRERSLIIFGPVWSDLLVDAERLTSLYTNLPPLEGLLLRSVHLSPYGPGLKLRVEFSRFPDRAPTTWTEAGCDRLEAQIHFLAVGEDLQLRGVPDQTVTDIRLGSIAQRRLRVSVQGAGFALEFTAADALQVSHLNAYRSGGESPYAARRFFENRVDQRLYQLLPPMTKRPFYDHP
jgi:hypothetical protein